MKKTLLAALLAATTPAFAAWQAQDLELSFLTTKITKAQTSVTEVNRFQKAQVTVADDGTLSGSIDLASVDTKVALRDQRLRDQIFKNAALNLSGKVDLAAVTALKVGQKLQLKQPLTLSFDGHSAPVTAQLSVLRLGDKTLFVTTRAPLVLDLTVLGVQKGIAHLAELAKLETIALQVPVTLSAVFEQH